ncbi:MAG TPA: PilZ domain-containing protein [Planctomycetota bacterium]|nr:PilZ domain-containing protein [Planctomycetota bacterium]
MSASKLPEEPVRKIVGASGVDPSAGAITRRKHPRFGTAGTVAFNRPDEQTRHAGRLADISEGGLAFLTDVSLAVGETLKLTWREEGETVSTDATVETVHSHPKASEFLVGVKFIR